MIHGLALFESGVLTSRKVALSDNWDEHSNGVKVTLDNEPEGMTTTTDNYGDFEFEGLEKVSPKAFQPPI